MLSATFWYGSTLVINGALLPGDLFVTVFVITQASLALGSVSMIALP